MEELEKSIAPAKASILEAVARGEPLRDVLARIVRLLETFSPQTVFGSILVVDEARSQLVLGAAPSLEDDYNARVDGVPLGPKAGSCGTAAFRGRPVVVSDISEDPLWDDYREAALAHGLRSCWSVPIVGDGKVLGTFAMYSREVRTPTPAEMQLLQAATSLAAVAIEKEKARIASEELRAEQARWQLLDQERSLLQQLIRDMPAMIAVTRGADHVVYLANRRFTQAVGQPQSAVLGRRLLDVLRCIEPRGLTATLDRVYASGRAFSRREMRLALRRPDGRQVNLFVDFVCQPLKDQKGRVAGLCLDVVDVTAPVRGREALRALQDEKDDVLVALAHDLQNPATVIAGNAAMLLQAIETGDEHDRELFRESLQWIAATSRHLSLRLTELMDLALLEVGQPPHLLREPVDLVPLVRRVFDDFAWNGDRHPMVVDCPEGSLIGEWDSTRVESILVNLIGNALKYSPSDQEVTVVLAREDGMARIEVVDRGIGIEERELARLFERYWRSPRAAGRAGSGIGLASAKRAVELLGGQINAQSRVGEGSRFTVLLPL